MPARRGLGWLAGQADICWSNRIGWYEGFHLLLSVTAMGLITGFGFGPASTHDQHLAETLFATRQSPSPRLPSAGKPAHGPYVADKGVAGERPRQRWQALWQVDLVTPPHQREPGASIGPKPCVAGWLALGRSLERSTTNS